MGIYGDYRQDELPTCLLSGIIHEIKGNSHE